MKTLMNISLILMPVLVVGLIVGATTALAQMQMPEMNPVAPLNHALQAAGASELSFQQESEISALIQEFRDAHQKPLQNADILNARQAYEEAILEGDSDAAGSQAEIIAKAQLDETVQHQKDAAAFAVKVISILSADSGQADALITQMGTRGFVRLVLGLVDRPGGPGPRGMGGAPHRRPGPPLAPGVAVP
jgi:hypothetical protein